MKKKIVTLLGMTVLACTLAVGCGSSGSQPSETEETVSEETADTAEDTASEETAESAEETESEAPEVALEDGVYTAEFDTDSGMFHVSEACDGKGTLTVEDGAMTIHISLASQNIVNLYPGLAEDAQKEGAKYWSRRWIRLPTATESQKRYMALMSRFLLWMRNLIWLCWEPREPGTTIR